MYLRWSVAKSDGPDPVTVGSELTYTHRDRQRAVLMTGLGASRSRTCCRTGTTSSPPSPRRGPAQLRGSRRVRCALGSLGSGASASVTIRVVPRAEGEFVNSATVSGADTDPQPANNTDTETTTVVPAPPAPKCGGSEATIVGTDGDDVIVGTDGHDVIAALSGDDQVRGLGGKDLVCGFGGNDRLKGQAHNDELRGGGGDDRLGGGSGNDLLRGGTGRDTCRGGGGNDVKRSC